MQIQEFSIPDLKLLTLKTFADDRGFFVERFKRSVFQELKLPTDFCQDNFSKSIQNVLRGLHYQWDRPQGKLVTCTSGQIFDVVVDIRKGSPTFGQHQSVELHGDRPQWFWIPAGFAHGFCVLSKEADLLYRCTEEYNPKGESGILWNDSELKIQWPVEMPILSEKDSQMKKFSEYSSGPKFFFGDNK